MAKLGAISVKIDKYFKETHVYTCIAFDCENNTAGDCNLKIINVGDDGVCGGFKKNTEGDNT